MMFHTVDEIKAAAKTKLECLLITSNYGEFDITLHSVTYVIKVHNGELKYAIPKNHPDGLRPCIHLDK
jgi:hypothetical protein